SHYFHFDSKFFYTLRPLLTEPGRLTMEYLAGRRMRFLHPVSMYIFVSIVYFLVVPPLSQPRDETTLATEKDRQTAAVSGNELIAIANIPIIASDSTLLLQSVKTATIELRAKQFKNLSFAEQATYLDSLKNHRNSKSSGIKQLIAELDNVHIARQDSTYEAYMNRQAALPSTLQDNWFEKALKKREIVIEQKTNENWSIKEEIKKYNPKLYFLLMPLFAFFLMLNFRRNKKYYIEHLIFTIHFFTAFFIFKIVTTPFDHFLFNNDAIIYDVMEFMAILWYIYTALTVFYQRKKWTTIRKIFSLSLLLLVSYSICYGVLYAMVYMMA
ncbi:MAG TPA: DUF3667 domain-containing protein, partial [Sphingobacteriaceae bacterium]